MFIAFAAAAWLLAAPPTEAPPPLTLDAVLARVAEANPDVRAARARAAASASRADAAGSEPAPMARAQQWMAPIDRPWDVAGTEMTMWGAEQRLVLPPKISARAAAARDEARAGSLDATRAAQESRARAVRAFVALWRAEREIDAHRDHAAIAHDIQRQAESRYAAGAGRQADVLRATLAASQRHADLALASARAESARAVLRALMAFPAGADLGRAELSPHADTTLPDDATLASRAAAQRPELQAAAARADGARAARRSARLARWLPDVGIGVDWMRARDGTQGVGTMLTVELPFLWGGAYAQARAASDDARASEAEAESAARAADAELADALARARAARETLDLYEREILPEATHAFDATRAAWAGNNASYLELLDAERARLDAVLAADAARETWEDARADLELAVGGPLDSNGGSR